MANYGATNNNFGYSREGLSGPGSSYYTSNPYGYGYSYEGQNGSIYTHSTYTYNGIYSDYHYNSYSGNGNFYGSETVSIAFSPYSAAPYSSAYGPLENLYVHNTIQDTQSGEYTSQYRTAYQSDSFSSGYTTSYSDIGSSEFQDGSFVPGTAANYSIYAVTNPYGYTTDTPNYRSY